MKEKKIGFLLAGCLESVPIVNDGLTGKLTPVDLNSFMVHTNKQEVK